jgi:hypothetical protein
MVSGVSTVVEHLSHQPLVKRSSSATVAKGQQVPIKFNVMQLLQK